MSDEQEYGIKKFQSESIIFCQRMMIIKKKKPEDQWSCKRSPDTWSWYIF